ncbi:MAG: TRAM domain-containing protein [Candidatus Korobacteraceae bacterium]
MELLIIRALFVLVVGLASYFLEPFGLTRLVDAVVGVALGGAVILFEIRLRSVSLKRLIGSAIGSVLGIIGAYLFCAVIRYSIQSGPTQSFLQLTVILIMSYVGLIVGASKGDLLNLSALGGIFGGEKQGRRSYKILDTSVIIDGRIADIAETGFLDGVLTIPSFVLRELQLVADSADSLKRNRGRRGLDILQRIQKITTLQVQIEGKIVTNDFNLNKVAQLHGVAVLNINELANSLKPIVLPGEIMKVFILKEGKEYNQGVAYLDDGTMVVVDNARKMIGKTVDISVTSVLQTTAGKMIFGKFDERGMSSMARPEPRPPDLRKSNPQPSLVPENSNSSASSSSSAGAIAPANGTTEPH